MKLFIHFVRNDYRARITYFIGLLLFFDTTLIFPFVNFFPTSILLSELGFNATLILFVFLIYKNRYHPNNLDLFTKLVFPLTIGAFLPFLLNHLKLDSQNFIGLIAILVLLILFIIYFTFNSFAVYKK
ncbi:MAG: hypothetical protein A3F72_13065 [Bacteroidetes bacterium RIFCSPLOWO2_12_FULL_35_15]|nr:MAG: hypothetical protein A3F72_13065 [Bacteroidetes bacterium RIFCSPLOWO2_12_FULL_35_15]